METREHTDREAWNKGKLLGQKAPLKPRGIWAIHIHLQNAHAVRDLAMFNITIQVATAVRVGSVTLNVSRRCGTWASRSMMLWRSPSRLRSEPRAAVCQAPLDGGFFI